MVVVGVGEVGARDRAGRHPGRFPASAAVSLSGM